jgi:hypothetical protein
MVPPEEEAEGFPPDAIENHSDINDDFPGGEGNPSAAEPPPETSFVAKEVSEPSPLSAALAAQIRAEELQRQAAMPKTILQQIAALATTDPFKHQAASWHHQAALSEGIADNSQEMADRVLLGVNLELQEQHRLATENVKARAPALMPRPTMPNASVAEPLSPPMPRKASIPMTAGVSRSTPDYSGKRQADSRSMTLTAEERLVARNSITDRADMPALSNFEKELMYARNKARLKRMRESGEYRPTSDEHG